MHSFATVIMAAGKGTRMKSDLAKVLHPILGRPMIHYVIELARTLGSERVIAIVGHQREKVRQQLAGEHIEFAVQDPQLGTGHAVMQAEALLHGYEGDVLILSGDVPLLTRDTMRRFMEYHAGQAAAGTVLTTIIPDATGYGRIVRSADGQVRNVVEHKDASAEERRIQEINSGIYVFNCRALFDALKQITAENAQNEYYLPDVLRILIDAGHHVSAFMTPDHEEIAGINTVEQLHAAERVLAGRANSAPSPAAQPLHTKTKESPDA